MANFRIEVNQAQVDHVNKMLYTVPDQARTVFRNAINRGLTAARVQGEKEIKSRYLITSGGLKRWKRITIYRAQQTASDVVGEINFAGGKVPLYRFRVSPKVRRNTNRFVNGRSGWKVNRAVKAGDIRDNGMMRMPNAFIAKFESGHMGIFERTGEKTSVKRTKTQYKDKLREYYGPAIADMLDFKEAREAVQDRAGEVVAQRIDHELWRVVSKI